MHKNQLAAEIEKEGIERVVYGKDLTTMCWINETLLEALRGQAAPPEALPKHTLQRAAAILREEAEVIRESNVTSDDDWAADTEEEERRHEEMMSLAEALDPLETLPSPQEP